MSRLSRKPPPPIEDSVEQFKFDIEDYLSKSPITNKFREENPNLQPTSSNETKMVEATNDYSPIAYNSLDPSIASTNKSIFSGTSPLLTQSPGHSHSSSFTGENGTETGTGDGLKNGGLGISSNRARSESVESSNDTENGTAFKTVPLAPEPKPEPQPTFELKRSESRLSKFKRFSLNKLDLGHSKKFIPTHKKFNSVNSPNNNRLSISSPTLNADNTFIPNSSRDSISGSRSSILTKRNSKMISNPQMKYSASNQSLNSVSTNNTICTNDTLTAENPPDSKSTTPYWKYHVLKFGKDLYVTTNPSVKHMYCRNGPGYYIEIIPNNESTKNGVKNVEDDGFTMIFKDAETQSDKMKPPIMLIHKRAKNDGGYFTVSLTRSSQLKKNMIKYGNELEKGKRNVFNGLSMPQTIPEQFIPYDKISNVKSFEHHEAKFKNYEFRDFNNLKWNVGSIPRVRTSKFNKFKNRLNDTNGNSDENEDGGDAWKFIGRQNIYFHQNYIDSNQIMPFKSRNPKDIYFQNEDNSNFPPVLCMFRPYKKKFSSKMKSSLNKRFSRHYGLHQNNEVNINNGNVQQPVGERNKINNRQLEHDIAGGEHKNYYIAGDGLYYYKNPVDDLPDDNKLGWVTIYEDHILQEKGMFDLVLGLTLAIGYENCMTNV